MNIDDYYEESYESDPEEADDVDIPIKNQIVINMNDSSDESEKIANESDVEDESPIDDIESGTETSDETESEESESAAEEAEEASESEADDSESASIPIVVTRGRQRIEKKGPAALVVPEFGKNKITPSKKLQELSQSSESECSSEQVKQCEAIIKTGVNKNKRCTHPPVGNLKYCKYHNKK